MKARHIKHRRYMNKVYAICAAFVLFLAGTWTASAQKCQADHEAIMTEKIAYFTKELQLSPEEAQQFWPVYNQLWNKKKELHRICRDKMKQIKQATESGASEAKVTALLESYLEAMDNCDKLREETRTEIGKVLPAVKTARLFWVEESFMMRQMRHLKDKKN